MRLMILFILVPVLLPTIAGAADVSLAWDPSISPNVTNYRIYYGTASRTYLKYDQTGNVTGYTVKGLTAGAWYFAATALDAGGNESDYSNEVSVVIANASSPVDLKVTGIPLPGRILFAIASNITANSATVVWKTDLDCSGTLSYGTSANNLNLSVASNNLGTTDHLAVTGPLASRSHYFYQVRSVCNGTAIQTQVFSFNTK